MRMEFVLKNTHTTGGEIREFLEDKTAKLDKYFQGRIHAHWTISYENDEHVANLHVTGVVGDVFGEARQHNLLSCIEEAVDKVERQLRKQKEIIKSHGK